MTDRTATTIYLNAQARDAMADLRIPDDDAYERFLGWLPPHHAGDSGPRHAHQEHLRFTGRTRPRHPYLP